MKKLFLMMFLLFACAGVDVGGDDLELGTLEQPWQVYCSTANPFGMNLATLRRCTRTNASDVCYFPNHLPNTPSTVGSPYFQPFPTAIKSNWSQAQRNFLGPQAVTVANWMDTTFRACTTVQNPSSPHFSVINTANPVGSGFLEITRSTTPFSTIPIDSGFTFVDAPRLIRMTCMDTSNVVEFYAASFKTCHKWEARIDYDSAMAWGSTTAQDQTILKNIFRHVWAMASGYGLRLVGSGDTYVTSRDIYRTVGQASWDNAAGSGETSWLCDYPLDPGETAPTWTCN